MRKFFEKIERSFDNSDLGYSARKLTAFTLVVMIVTLHVVYIQNFNIEYLAEVLIIDLCGVAFFLGLITVAQIIQLRGGKNEEAK